MGVYQPSFRRQREIEINTISEDISALDDALDAVKEAMKKVSAYSLGASAEVEELLEEAVKAMDGIGGEFVKAKSKLEAK